MIEKKTKIVDSDRSLQLSNSHAVNCTSFCFLINYIWKNDWIVYSENNNKMINNDVVGFAIFFLRFLLGLWLKVFWKKSKMLVGTKIKKILSNKRERQKVWICKKLTWQKEIHDNVCWSATDSFFGFFASGWNHLVKLQINFIFSPKF